MWDDSQGDYSHESTATFYADNYFRDEGRTRAALPAIARVPIVPPQLVPADPGTTRSLTRITIADLRFPSTTVRRRAESITRQARANGTPHSLKLWRQSYIQALLTLSREACGAAESAPCESLFWAQRDNEFSVSVIFGQATRMLSH
jgi:hypothetical protein